MTTNAALYCRISDDQAGQGLGVKRQEDLLRKLAVDKGWTVGAVYTDNDRSAYSGKPRPQFERMLTALREGEHGAVLVVDTDRLTRTPAELEGFITLADDLGIALGNVSGDMDLSSADGRFRARILGAVARQESEKKSERLKREVQQQVSNGTHRARRRLFGWADGNLQPHPVEGRYVVDGVRDVLNGVTLSAIVRRWNDADITTPTGSKWLVHTVRDNLALAHHAGLMTYKGETLGEGVWTPIVDRSAHDRLTALLNGRKRSGPRATYLLTGIIKCRRCGSGLVGNVTRGTGHYRCPDNGAACGGLGIVAEDTEHEVTEQVLTALEDAKLPSVQPDDNSAELSQQLRDDEQALQELTTARYVDRVLGHGEFMAARKALEDRMARTNRQLATSAAPPIPADVRSWWDTADVDRKRALLAAVVDRVEISPAERRGARWTPERIQIIWMA